MTAPVPDDSDNAPEYFEVYVVAFDGDPETADALLPHNATDPRDESLVYVGNVDGPALYGRTGLGKKTTFTVIWGATSPFTTTDPPFAYGTAYTAVFEGRNDPNGGTMRATTKDITFTRNATTGKVTATTPLDEDGIRASWFYEPAPPPPPPPPF